MKKKILGIAIVLVIGTGLIFFAPDRQTAQIYEPFTLDERGQFPGEFKGVGTVFDVQKSGAYDITVTFDKETEASIESIPGMMTFVVRSPADGSQEVQISVANLEPDTTYYKYVEHLDTREDLTTDETGTLSFVQSTPHEQYIMIFTRPSTYFIRDDANGGDCQGRSIGTWSASTKTCTLVTDITEGIEIKDRDITLDGNGHSITGSGSNMGVYANASIFENLDGIIIKNLTISNFSKGIEIVDIDDVFVDNVTINNSVIGIELDNTTNSTVSNSTVTSSVIRGIELAAGADDNTVNNNTVSSNNVGIRLGNTNRNSITRNTVTTNTSSGIAISGLGGNGTFVWQNNFINNAMQVDIFADGDTQFHRALPEGGNYWSDHVCTGQFTNPNLCNERYLVADPPLFSAKYDEHPWRCENGWLSTTDCSTATNPSIDPPISSGDWGEIDNASGVAKLYMDKVLDDSRVHKILPNDWVIKILDDSGSVWEVEDVTDGTIGWMQSNEVEDDPNRQNEFRAKAQVTLEDIIQERKDKILESVTHYLSNSASTDSLYSSNNEQNNFSQFEQAGIVTEVVLGIIEEEIAIVNYDNDFVSFDYGHGLGQVTTRNSVGEGSQISIPTCETSTRSTCYSETKRIPILNTNGISYDGKEYLRYQYYDNSHQSFHANIKDSLRVLQNKYASAKNFYALSDAFSSMRTGETIDGKHTRIFHSIRGYNSWGQCPNILFNEKRIHYIDNVKQYTENASSIFSIPVSERSDLTELLKQFDIVSREEQFIHVCSPAYLQVYDNNGNMTGFDGQRVIQEIPLVVYDEEYHKQAFVLLDERELFFRVIGEESGTYSLPAGTTYFGTELRFQAVDIPTSTGEAHEYAFNWAEKEVTIKVDKDGDGIFEAVFTADLILNATEFNDAYEKALNKMTICHVPPGNPSAAHTISIGKAA